MTVFLRPIIVSGLLLLVFGFVFPGLLWGVGRLLPERADGSPVVVAGRTVGFERIGQQFGQARYFQGRPSAVGYNAAATGASNAAPGSPDYLRTVRARLDTFLLLNPTVARRQVPVELVTASASGIDPDLSPAAAYVQVARVAQARHLPTTRVRALVDEQVQGPWLGFVGPAHVSVLRLNLALDGK